MAEVQIQVHGLVNGGKSPFDGQWLVEYDPCRDGVDPWGRKMRAHIVCTPDRSKGRVFKDLMEAFECVKAVDRRDPRGGRFTPGSGLNRPLTAFTLSFVRLGA